MSFTKFIIDIAVKNPKIESYNNYLFIGPHPDDIEIGAGATVSKLKKLNKKVTFLICLDGRFGKENLKEDISCEQLIEIRKNECLESAKLLGVDNCLFLSLCDGGQYSDREVLEGIAKTINDIKPDIIFIEGIGYKGNVLVGFSNSPKLIDGVDVILHKDLMKG